MVPGIDPIFPEVANGGVVISFHLAKWPTGKEQSFFLSAVCCHKYGKKLCFRDDLLRANNIFQRYEKTSQHALQM